MELKQRSNFRMAFVLRIIPLIVYNIRILLVSPETHFCKTPISCGFNKKNQTILHPCVVFWYLHPCFYHVNCSKLKVLEERACLKLHYMPAQLHRLDGIPPPHNKKCLNEWSTNNRRSNKYGVMRFVDYFQIIPLILTVFIFELPVPGEYLNWSRCRRGAVFIELCNWLYSRKCLVIDTSAGGSSGHTWIFLPLFLEFFLPFFASRRFVVFDFFPAISWNYRMWINFVFWHTCIFKHFWFNSIFDEPETGPEGDILHVHICVFTV